MVTEADHAADNTIVDKCYRYVKGDRPEPYSPAVASLVGFVRQIVLEERARVRAEKPAASAELAAIIKLLRDEAFVDDDRPRRDFAEAADTLESVAGDLAKAHAEVVDARADRAPVAQGLETAREALERAKDDMGSGMNTELTAAEFFAKESIARVDAALETTGHHRLCDNRTSFRELGASLGRLSSVVLEAYQRLTTAHNRFAENQVSALVALGLTGDAFKALAAVVSTGPDGIPVVDLGEKP